VIKRVLIGLGGTPYVESKMRHALEFAQRFGAELTGVTVADLARLIDVGPIPMGAVAAAQTLRQHRMETAEQHIEKAIEAFRTRCGEEGVRWHIVREEGDPFEELISLSRYHDLTILGLQGLFEYGVLPDAHAYIGKLVARNVRPVLAVANEYREIRKVFVAYNGSMESAKAMKTFAQFSLWPDAEVMVACYHMKPHDAGPLVRDAAEYLRLYGYHVETMHPDVSPEEGLLRDADAWGADLIVMGASGRSNILRLIMGDTAEHIISHSKLPMLISH
jgi:nucleotide-binding universal stress UspA family protein